MHTSFYTPSKRTISGIAVAVLRRIFLPPEKTPRRIHWERNERGLWEVHIPEDLLMRR